MIVTSLITLYYKAVHFECNSLLYWKLKKIDYFFAQVIICLFICTAAEELFDFIFVKHYLPATYDSFYTKIYGLEA